MKKEQNKICMNDCGKGCFREDSKLICDCLCHKQKII